MCQFKVKWRREIFQFIEATRTNAIFSLLFSPIFFFLVSFFNKSCLVHFNWFKQHESLFFGHLGITHL